MKLKKFLGTKKYDTFYDRIEYAINLKSSITYFFPHCFAKISEKILTLHNVIIYNVMRCDVIIL